MSAPPTDDDDLRRERILKAADELLAHYGTRKTTVADIARRAGVAVGSVYLEFDSKDALVGTLSELRFGLVLDAMRAAVRDATDPATALCAALRARTRAFLELAGSGTHGRDLMHCGACTGVALAHERFAARQHALLVELLEQGHARGQLGVSDPHRAAHALIDAHVAFAPPLLFAAPLRTDPLSALDALHQVLVDGLRRR